MNINKQYAWQHAEDSRENSPLLPRSLRQEEYKVLRKGLDAELSKQQIRDDIYDDCQDIPDPTALDPTRKNLLDDCFLSKQNKAEAYNAPGRHNNCDTVYIAQNNFRLTRHTIRENSNVIILFPQDVKNLIHIHVDHCASDLSLAEFKKFCHGVWSSGKHNFVAIDLTSGPIDGKHRHNFNRFYFPTGTI